MKAAAALERAAVEAAPAATPESAAHTEAARIRRSRERERERAGQHESDHPPPGHGSAHRPAGEREGDAGAGLESLADLLNLPERARLVHEGLPVRVHHHAAVDDDRVDAAAVGVVDEVVD